MEEAQRSSLVPKALLIPDICLFPLSVKTHNLLPGLTCFSCRKFFLNIVPRSSLADALFLCPSVGASVFLLLRSCLLACVVLA